MLATPDQNNQRVKLWWYSICSSLYGKQSPITAGHKLNWIRSPKERSERQRYLRKLENVIVFCLCWEQCLIILYFLVINSLWQIHFSFNQIGRNLLNDGKYSQLNISVNWSLSCHCLYSIQHSPKTSGWGRKLIPDRWPAETELAIF